jgi:hypothetical protein
MVPVPINPIFINTSDVSTVGVVILRAKTAQTETDVRFPSRALSAAAVVSALPFGWGLGVLAAYLLVGPDFGVFPVLTIIPSIAAAMAFAVSPVLTAGKRLAILVIGTGLLMLLGTCC